MKSLRDGPDARRALCFHTVCAGNVQTWLNCNILTSLQNFLQGQRAAEEIQGASDGHIDFIFSFGFQKFKIPETSYAAGVSDREGVHFREKPDQRNFDPAGFPLHIHRVNQEFHRSRRTIPAGPDGTGPHRYTSASGQSR